MKHISPISFTKRMFLDDMPIHPLRKIEERAKNLGLSDSEIAVYISNRIRKEQYDPKTKFRQIVHEVLKKNGREELENTIFNIFVRSTFSMSKHDIYGLVKLVAEKTDDDLWKTRHLGKAYFPFAREIRDRCIEIVKEENLNDISD